MKHHNPKSLPIYALRYKSVREVTVWIYITGVSESLLCGSGAGILSKMIIYPLDIIKKRLEIQGFEKARTDFGSVRHYKGLNDCLTTIVKQEGPRGLFKGLSPSLLKAGLAASSNFLVYEQCCYLLRVFYLSSSWYLFFQALIFITNFCA